MFIKLETNNGKDLQNDHFKNSKPKGVINKKKCSLILYESLYSKKPLFARFVLRKSFDKYATKNGYCPILTTYL